MNETVGACPTCGALASPMTDRALHAVAAVARCPTKVRRVRGGARVTWRTSIPPDGEFHDRLALKLELAGFDLVGVTWRGSPSRGFSVAADVRATKRGA